MGTSPHAVAAVIDSQSVKVAATVPRATSGYDAGKKTSGRKRHIIVDLKGLPLFVMVTPADMHDNVAAREAFFRLRLMDHEITMASAWAAAPILRWPRCSGRTTSSSSSSSTAATTPPLAGGAGSRRSIRGPRYQRSE